MVLGCWLLVDGGQLSVVGCQFPVPRDSERPVGFSGNHQPVHRRSSAADAGRCQRQSSIVDPSTVGHKWNTPASDQSAIVDPSTVGPQRYTPAGDQSSIVNPSTVGPSQENQQPQTNNHKPKSNNQESIPRRELAVLKPHHHAGLFFPEGHAGSGVVSQGRRPVRQEDAPEVGRNGAARLFAGVRFRQQHHRQLRSSTTIFCVDGCIGPAAPN